MNLARSSVALPDSINPHRPFTNVVSCLVRTVAALKDLAGLLGVEKGGDRVRLADLDLTGLPADRSSQ